MAIKQLSFKLFNPLIPGCKDGSFAAPWKRETMFKSLIRNVLNKLLENQHWMMGHWLQFVALMTIQTSHKDYSSSDAAETIEPLKDP